MTTANVGWGRDTWNSGAWNTSPDAAAVITGSSVNSLLNNASVQASSLTAITGRAVTSAVGTTNAGASVFQPTGSVQASVSLGTVSTGEGRQITITTAGELSVNINAGLGWGRDAWNEGPWNQSLTGIVTGSGVVFIEDGQQLTSSLNNVSSVTGNSSATISGNNLTVSRGDITLNTNNFIAITGEPLVSTTVDSFAVVAGGSVTINTPTFEANVEVNDITVGTRANITITGGAVNISLGDITTSSENIIPITGGQVSSTSNTISILTDQKLTITGSSITISSASIIPNSSNFLSMTGNQANTNVATLKFWDPITGNITETWTNIH
tara:strand:- start:70 stop:1047 length:978 start_codon:yes stop_codon:yes gene_type:complete